MKLAELLTEAVNTDISTQAGLVKFLIDNGFSRGKPVNGAVSFMKPKSAKSVLNKIKKVWKTVKEKTEYGVSYETLECNGVEITSQVFDGQMVYVTLWPARFKSADKTDIYKVTKYHPAWAYVQDYLDSKESKSAQDRKEAVDQFMKDNDLTPSALQAAIVKRTRENTVHSLYDAD